LKKSVFSPEYSGFMWHPSRVLGMGVLNNHLYKLHNFSKVSNNELKRIMYTIVMEGRIAIRPSNKTIFSQNI